jgi:AraC-like DNA-binding protein
MRDERHVTSDWARFGQAGAVELLHAHYVRHVYERHCHDGYAIGVTESGVQRFTCRGGAHASSTGTVMAFNPDDPHDGRAADDDGFTYRMLYIPPELVRGVLADAAERPAGLPLFARPLLQDAVLAQLVSAAHQACVEGPALARDERLQAMVLRLAAHAPPRHLVEPGDDRAAVRRARDYLHAAFAEDITLDALAGVARMSRFHLSRLFTRAHGLPPHAYLLQLRLAEAKRLLAAGEAPAEIAAAVGFVDQSHLTRRFKGAFGVTPGQYARAAARQA